MYRDAWWKCQEHKRKQSVISMKGWKVKISEKFDVFIFIAEWHESVMAFLIHPPLLSWILKLFPFLVINFIVMDVCIHAFLWTSIFSSLGQKLKMDAGSGRHWRILSPGEMWSDLLVLITHCSVLAEKIDDRMAGTSQGSGRQKCQNPDERPWSPGPGDNSLTMKSSTKGRSQF
jgi:hypothetical protein